MNIFYAYFFRENLAKFIKVRKTTDDCILWIQISKEIVDGSKDILLGTAYVLPTGSLLVMFFKSLLMI